jgi:hypothetical protein
MGKSLLVLSFSVFFIFAFAKPTSAQTKTPTPKKIEVVVKGEATPTPSPTPSPTETPAPRVDLTVESQAVVEPLKKALDDQALGAALPANPIKYAIRNAVNGGVPVNTLVLLLLLPGVATIIAATRHLIGIRGFGILMPASLSVVFLAIGPIVGIGLFLIIVFTSTFIRFFLHKSKIRLQYLPRMSLILLFVVIGILVPLFLAPMIKKADLINVSIFPVLFLVLLSEDFTRVQLGKSFKVAVTLTTETILLSVLTFLFLTLKTVQTYVLLNPEVYLLSLVVIDILLGKFVGLRFLEYYRFRKLIGK